VSLIRNANLRKIRDIMGGRGNYLEIPDFQRSFSWTGDQAKDLFDDINDFIKEHGKKFLKYQYFLGSIVAYPESDALKLIDGQQRIASLTILAACIRDRLLDLDEFKANQLHFDLIQEELRSGSGAKADSCIDQKNSPSPEQV